MTEQVLSERLTVRRRLKLTIADLRSVFHFSGKVVDATFVRGLTGWLTEDADQDTSAVVLETVEEKGEKQ